MARVLVTGGLGFIGVGACEALAARGHVVTSVDSCWFNGRALGDEARREVEARRARLRASGVTHEEADVSAPGVVERLSSVHAPEVVVHLAGLSRADLASRVSPGALASTAGLLDRVLEGIAGTGVRRVVLASSSLAYGPFEADGIAETHPLEPVEPYGAGKHASEVLLRAWSRRTGVEAVILRPTAVYGPGDFNERVVTRFVEASLSGRPMTLAGDGTSRLDFTYVDDAAEAFALAATVDGVGGEAFNVSYGRSRALVDLARIVAGYVPGARMEFTPDVASRPARGRLDGTKARMRLGFTPRVSLEEGVRRMLAARGHAVPDAAPPSPPRPVPLARPSIGEAELAAVARALRSPTLSGGPEVERFEAEFAAYHGSAGALACNSGVSALVLALRAADVTGEVLVPAFTYAATANAVVLAGARPVFVDVEERSMGLDPALVEAAITPRTQAILAVHLAGRACRIEALRRLADARGLVLVEDVAQACGAEADGRKLGTIGHYGCFSFFPTKNMSTGEGGMLLAQDPARLRRARSLAAHGVDRALAGPDAPPWARRVGEPGYNFRLAAPLAALGRVQLGRLDAMNGARRAAGLHLAKLLAGAPVRLPHDDDASPSTYHLFVVRPPAGTDRDRLVHALRARGVEASVHYDRAVPDEPAYEAQARGAFPTARTLAREVISLPMHAAITEDELVTVAAALREALEAARVSSAA